MFSPERLSAEDVIRILRLEPLPYEGGFFRRTGQAGWSITSEERDRAGEVALSRVGSARLGYSVIYALFTPQHFSAFHRVTADEIWCFHAGDPLELYRLFPDRHGESVVLGNDLAAAHTPQQIVPTGVWQAARVQPGGRWSLVSCFVSPEFRWEGFELGRRVELQQVFPAFTEAITLLTRD